MANKLLEQARARAAQATGVLTPAQQNLATGMASTAPDVINTPTNQPADVANAQDTGTGKAGEAPSVARSALSPTTTAPIDNERGGLPMAEDPDRIAGQAIVKTIQPTVGVQSGEYLSEEEIRRAAEEIHPSYNPYKPVEGDYKALRLKQFYKNNGDKVVPNADGWYHPADDEESDMLEQYAAMHDKVEAFSKS